MSAADPTVARAAQVDRAKAWTTLAVVAMILGLALILGRVVQLKVAPDPRLAAAAGRSDSARAALAPRGNLLDRRGRLVATSTVGHRLFVDPSLVEDPFTIAVDLGRLLDVDPVPLDRRLAGRLDRRYVALVDSLEPWQEAAIRAADLTGVGLEPRLVRLQPNGDVGRALIGFVGADHAGLTGIEHRLDERLRQHDGRLAYLRDVRRRPLWIRPGDWRPPAPGTDVRLSLDLAIQAIAERAIAEAVERQNAAGGRLVVLDCRTGELLAMTDVLRTTSDGREPAADDPRRALDPAFGRNRCVTDPYEPGSTFKPFVWAVATELGRVELDEILPTPAAMPHRTSEGRRIRDSHYIENADWVTVLVRSLNSGMAIAAERLEPAELQDAIRRFGFGRRTGRIFPGESPGIVTAPGDWSHYTQTSVSMGHEIAVTTVQMVRAFSVFARNGTLPTVRITAAEPGAGSGSGAEPDGEPWRLVHRVLSESLVLTVREALEEVVHGSPHTGLREGTYRLFGKSGTAQLPMKEGGGYHEDRYVSSFIAGAPFDEPRLVVLCVIDDPDRSKGHYGSAIAGPVVRSVVEDSLRYLGVAPDRNVETPERPNVEMAQFRR